MKLLVLDGNSIVNRAFYGVKLLSTQDGFYTNAIYGFMNILLKLKSEVEPDAVAIAFDLKTPTFRHKAFDGYKAGRKGMPSELAMQIPKLKELLESLGYKIVECEGFEADDILGTLADSCEKSGNYCVIATGDRDLLQLVSDKVTVRITSTKFGRPQAVLYDEDKIKEVYGIKPINLIDVKALQGDTSDNIPGVKGIGEKTALNLIQQFGDLDNVYKNIDSEEIKKSVQNKLIYDKDSAYLSYMLGTIVKNAPIDTEISHYIQKNIDEQKAFEILSKLEMFSLIEKLIDKSKINQIPQEQDTIKNIEFLINDLSFSKNKAEKYFVCYNLEEYKISKLFINANDKCYAIDDLRLIDEATEFLAQIDKEGLIVHDVKQLAYALQKAKKPVVIAGFDTLLGAYIINPQDKKYDVKNLYQRYNINIDSIENGSDMEENALLCAILPKLYEKIYSYLKENDQLKLLTDIELPFAYILADMQVVGFEVSPDSIKIFGEELDAEIKELTEEIYGFVGYEFNINSPKQLSEALFDKLGLKPVKKTKSGYSTNAEVLEKLKFAHPSVELILKYRALTKLKSTYCDGLLKAVCDDNRIHTTFNQTETRTGRISSIEPNLQNIPVRTERGRQIRKFFKAKDNYVLVDADYSQIELRILADIANDKNMLKAFNSGADIHTITASQVFNMPENMVTPLMRTQAKAVNFGIVYGMGAYSLSNDISVTVKKAQEYINNYLAHYEGIAQYKRDIVEQAKENGYVNTLFNRKRYIPEITASNHNLRAFGERVAMNMPIQGTAADVIKIATINVAERIKREKLTAKIIMQVHDEIIVEAPENEADVVKKILKEEMENCIELKLKLIVNISVGKTWYDTKD